MLFQDKTHACQSCADDHTGPLTDARLSKIELCIFNSHLGGHDGKLRRAVHALKFFGKDIGRRIEILDLAGKTGGELGGIKSGDIGNATTALGDSIPKGFFPEADRRDDPQARDNDSAVPGARHRSILI